MKVRSRIFAVVLVIFIWAGLIAGCEPSTTTIYLTQSEQTVELVWIPRTGKRYHANASCSGMKNPSQVTLQRAEELGYTPCGNCY